MQALCTDRMKIARELLDYGVLGEGAENLARLLDCGRSAGCAHWHDCLRKVDDQWLSQRPDRQVRIARA